MQKSYKGFTLIELMIVVAIIAIIAAIAIPGIMAARRTSNEAAALGNIKSFSTAMAAYSSKQADQSYPADESVLGDYYSHIKDKGGYHYWYSSDGKHYMYYAYPASLSAATKIYFVDESNRIFSADADGESISGALNEPEVADWNEPSETRLSSPSGDNIWQKKS